MTPSQIILSAHAGTTLAMTGLIWFVQIVHYPLFRLVPPSTPPLARDAERTPDARLARTLHVRRYERAHQRRTTLVVAPLMLVELACAILIFTLSLAPTAQSALALALLVAIWLSTGLVQVPLHIRLERAYDDALVRRLVLTNWARTILWTIRAMLAIHMLGDA